MIKAKKDFKILLIYPNLPLMLVPPLSIAIFTGLFKKAGYKVDLFDTTLYVPSETISSPQNRTLYRIEILQSDEHESHYYKDFLVIMI